jgi:hypothetical protein
MSQLDRIAYYEKYILKLKKEDDLKKALAAKGDVKNKQNNKPAEGSNLSGIDVKNASKKGEAPMNLMASANIGKESDFYFYNTKSVAYGKLQFKKTWGNRAYKNNWRLSSEAATNNTNDPNLNNDPNLDLSIAIKFVGSKNMKST